MANTTFSARYAMVAAKNRWEEQGFFLDDSQCPSWASIFCFDWMTKGMSQLDTTGPALADYLGWNSNLGRASCRVIGLCLSPNNCTACLYPVTLDG
ncbi:hypothetical protein V6N11_034429 [Hibiscus sabdariffa]|uniref:Uncharacterized protein n=1 Tax=Hibiscus sabdariffa TaxID=183260 RepID=A0ABR2NMI5_9ROSI